MSNTLLGIELPTSSEKHILEQIESTVKKNVKCTHVVSLNPEILVIANENPEFMRALNNAEVKIIDGVGVVLAARLLKRKIGVRLTGVDLMKRLLGHDFGMSLRIALIGGYGDLAERLANRYSQARPEATIVGLQGFKNIEKPEKSEENRLKSIIADLRPHLVFVSFGSPKQEIWVENHRELFKNSVVIGVGGAFDFLGRRVKRAPRFIQVMGLEWLFRLAVQPWRWRRQLRLVRFTYLVIRQALWKEKS